MNVRHIETTRCNTNKLVQWSIYTTQRATSTSNRKKSVFFLWHKNRAQNGRSVDRTAQNVRIAVKVASRKLFVHSKINATLGIGRPMISLVFRFSDRWSRFFVSSFLLFFFSSFTAILRKPFENGLTMVKARRNNKRCVHPSDIYCSGSLFHSSPIVLSTFRYNREKGLCPNINCIENL